MAWCLNSKLKLLPFLQHYNYLLFLLSFAQQSFSEKCIQSGDCACRFPNGQTVDLNSEFRNILYVEKQGQDYNYLFNPCKPFINGSDTTFECFQKVFVCQVASNNKFNYNLGNQSGKFVQRGDELFLTYNTSTRNTSVSLKCSSSTKLTTFIETPPKNYQLTLESPAVCFKEEEPSGLSLGSVLLILFFIASSAYLFGGITCLYCVRGARGIELIPNYEFWMDFPLLVRDGIIFLIGGCRTETRYERI